MEGEGPNVSATHIKGSTVALRAGALERVRACAGDCDSASGFMGG